MAATIEWRLKNNGNMHAGSVETNKGTTKTILYAHPRDRAGPIYSGAANWSYTQEDATTDPVVGNDIEVTVMGFVSFETYRSMCNAWSYAPWFVKALAWIASWVSEAGPQVYAPPLATALQPSGELIYEAYLKFVPPEPISKQIDIRVVMTVEAMTPVTPPSVGSNGTLANVVAFNETGEVTRIRAFGPFGQSLDTDSKTVDYSVTVEPGKEVKVASADASIAFYISQGNAYFSVTASAKITV